MKYKVRTKHLNKVDKGTVIHQDRHGYWCRKDGTVVFNDKGIVERNPDWFEPVEEVSEGQYWEWCSHIYRVGEAHSERESWVKDISTDKEMPLPRNELEYNGRKLATPEIEQALQEEFERRYDVGDSVKGDWWEGNYINTKPVPIKEDTPYYDEDEDILYHKGWAIYEKGNWAQIVDQTPTIEINGYEAEFHENYVKFGCAKIHKNHILKLHEEIFQYVEQERATEPYKVITGVRIGEGLFSREQIKQIADYYD